jgi:hypothetical protein
MGRHDEESQAPGRVAGEQVIRTHAACTTPRVRQASTRPLFGRRMRVPPCTPWRRTCAHHTRADCMLAYDVLSRNGFPLLSPPGGLHVVAAWSQRQRSVYWGRSPWGALSWRTRGRRTRAYNAPRRAEVPCAPGSPCFLHAWGAALLTRRAAVCWWWTTPTGRKPHSAARPPHRQPHLCGRLPSYFEETPSRTLRRRPSYFRETPFVLWGDTLSYFEETPLVLSGDPPRTLERRPSYFRETSFVL